MKKFELTNEKKELNGKTFFRIISLVDIPSQAVTKGGKGGWVEKEDCLSHRGTCWIAEDAMVEGGSTVSGDAYIYGQAYVGSGSRICLEATVGGEAKIMESTINGKAYVGRNARIEKSSIFGRVSIAGLAVVTESRIASEVIIEGNTIIHDSELLGLERSKITGNAKIKALTITSSNPVKDLFVHEDAEIEDVSISGKNIQVRNQAIIKNSTIEGNDILLFGLAFIKTGVTLLDNCKIGGCTTISLDGWGNIFENVTLDDDMEVMMSNYHLFQ